VPSFRRSRNARALAVAWCGLLASAALGPACTTAESPGARSPRTYAENAQRDYERAVKALTDRNWELVDPLFSEVRRKYPYSRYARLAELRMADADYEQENFAEAIAGYKAFVREYPNDAEVPYARFRIAKSQYQSVSQSLLLPPLEERDLGSVNDALETITDYLEDFPRSEHAEELRYMLEVVVGLLARHELYVARYYLHEDRFDAAEARVRHALEVLPVSGLEPEALVLLGEIHLRQKKRDEARKAFARVLAEHPDSPFTVPARNHLARLGEAVGTLRISARKDEPKAVPR